jgi:glycosyltransferase involved in cell wall biosynthesis
LNVLILYTELADYFLACLKQLENHVDEIHVIHWPLRDEAPFEFKVPDNVILHNKTSNQMELLKLSKLINPSLILCSGWVDRNYLKIVKFYSKKIPTVLLFDNQWKASLKQGLGLLLSPFLIKNKFSNVWVTGSSSKSFAKKLGFSDDKILTGLYSADTPKFSLFRQKYLESKNNQFPKVFLYVGRYVRHKGIFDLWNAFIELQNENPTEWELWCLGTGEEFENRILHPKIKHFGFIQPLEMNKYLSKAGVYILPSIYEPWGVSVHEMAAAGFPMLLSKNVGSSEEFLDENINGYHFNSGNKFEIKQKLKKIINLSESDLLTMGNNSFNLSLKNSPKIWAEKLISLL